MKIARGKAGPKAGVFRTGSVVQESLLDVSDVAVMLKSWDFCFVGFLVLDIYEFEL